MKIYTMKSIFKFKSFLQEQNWNLGSHLAISLKSLTNITPNPFSKDKALIADVTQGRHEKLHSILNPNFEHSAKPSFGEFHYLLNPWATSSNIHFSFFAERYLPPSSSPLNKRITFWRGDGSQSGRLKCF